MAITTHTETSPTRAAELARRSETDAGAAPKPTTCPAPVDAPAAPARVDVDSASARNAAGKDRWDRFAPQAAPSGAPAAPAARASALSSSAGVQKTLAANPSIQTHQDLINHYYAKGGGTWTGASRLAVNDGTTINQLVRDRSARFTREAPAPTTPTPPVAATPTTPNPPVAATPPAPTKPNPPVAATPAPTMPNPPVAATPPAPTTPTPPVAATPPAPPSTTLRQVFDRIDRNRDGSLSRPEVKSSMEAAGIGSGFFGGMKVDGATSALVDGLDKNRDGNVSFGEFAAGGHQLAPAGMQLDPARMQDPAHIDAAVAALYRDADSNNDGALTKAELTAHQTRAAEQAGQDNASTRGDIAATLALKNLDDNGDGRLQKHELAGFLKDVGRQQAAGRDTPRS